MMKYRFFIGQPNQSSRKPILRSQLLLMLLFLLLLLTACTVSVDNKEEGEPLYEVDEQPSRVFYEIFVRAFYDSDGDGIGDFNGVTAKLDYLKELGIGGIWLMPINESPSYHGYDTTDYYALNAEYGTLEDFQHLLDEAKKRDIHIIMDLVVNHSSNEHPWFKEAQRNPDSPYRDWFIFAEPDQKLASDGAVGGNPWHKYGMDHYLGIFWSGMPDFNFYNEAVRQEMIKIGQYWLNLGVDGFRLDAAKHIFADFKSNANTNKVKDANQLWWQEFRAGMLEVKPDVYLIGEVWDSPSIIAPYFDNALDSAFNFDLAGKLLSAASNESDPNLAFTLKRIYDAFNISSNSAFIDAPFLANHDQNRPMTVLRGNIDHARMAASLLLTLPGNPYIYYGEEIGMQGAKPDEHIREPMLWYANAVAGQGQTTWIAKRYNREVDHVSVENQIGKQDSLLEHYRTLISWRNKERTLRDGTIDVYSFEEKNSDVSAYMRVTAYNRVLVVHNLSKDEHTMQLTESVTYGTFKQLAYTTHEQASLKGNTLILPPYTTVILK